MTGWEEALSLYSDKKLTKDDLRPYWQAELERILGFRIDEENMPQANPLFDNGWSPLDSAGHIRRVYVLKGMASA